ncbi:MAG: NapC/NirT family cytochrome c, partial [Desulfobulbaceae bacterium]|nr:NapC/NirT family cytochrome c [Desulfobulbaceae bacterium]
MITIPRAISIFIKTIQRNKISLIGVIVISLTFPLLLLGGVVEIFGWIHSQLFGAFLYGFLTPLFIVGHIVFFIGFFFVPSSSGKTSPCSYAYIKEHFNGITEKTSFMRIFFLATILGVGNFLILVLVAYMGHHYSETPEFCGTLCHEVMGPESLSYQNSPHSRVACVECHVGNGLKNFVMAKVAGVHQVVAVTTGIYNKPIRVPPGGLRPARDTCEHCHRPELFHGKKLKVKDKYASDEENTHLQTVLLLNIGSGGADQEAQGIHWHVSENNRIDYTYEDPMGRIISEVKLTRADGRV